MLVIIVLPPGNRWNVIRRSVAARPYASRAMSARKVVMALYSYGPRPGAGQAMSNRKVVMALYSYGPGPGAGRAMSNRKACFPSSSRRWLGHNCIGP